MIRLSLITSRFFGDWGDLGFLIPDWFELWYFFELPLLHLKGGDMRQRLVASESRAKGGFIVYYIGDPWGLPTTGLSSNEKLVVSESRANG